MPPAARTGTLFVMACLLACACTTLVNGTPSSAAAEDVLEISGSLSYRQRIALPPDSIAVVELTAGDDIVALGRIDLGGRQVPVPFKLQVPRNNLIAGAVHRLQGTLYSGGRAAWVTEPLPVDISPARIDAGMLELRPAPEGVSWSTLRCGDREVQVRLSDQRLLLTLDGRTYELLPIPSASGARWASTGEARIGFWNKGAANLLEVGGQALPCAEPDAALRSAAGQAASPYRARGNEPAWLVTVTPGYCTDSMTGMPYPDTVELQFQGQRFKGCGGDPASLLRGEWVVEDIAGEGIVGGSRLTVSFDADGRVGGRSGCNQYTGTYRIGGERIEIGSLSRTMMACDPALDSQEGRFLDVLEQMRGFELDDGGALILRGADGRTLSARRP